jgi:hypothetical protein
MTKDEFSMLTVLIVAYRRAQNVKEILEVCLNSGIKSIYITVDAPKTRSTEAVRDHQQVLQVIENISSGSHPNVTIRVRVAESNYGCAVSVISGCDWAFQSASELLVIEDDCIPNSTFFEFANNNLNQLSLEKGVVMVCGTQFAPISLTGKVAMLSRYPLTWGWGTNREVWHEIRKSFEQNPYLLMLSQMIAINSDTSFWRAGSRRALSGVTDVWDTVLVEYMLRRNLLSILPPRNLVLNNGNDTVATHIALNSKWTYQPTHSDPILYTGRIEKNLAVEIWIRKFCYKISLRHLVSTRITLIADCLLLKKRKFRISLVKRLETAKFSIYQINRSI